MKDHFGPLPEPAVTHDRHGNLLLIGPAYTAEQMVWYAMKAVAAERERCAKLCEENHELIASSLDGYDIGALIRRGAT